MTLLLEIEESMGKLLNAIKKDPNLLIGPKTTGFSDKRITCQNLEDAAGNHFFDDCPDKFGISEIEAHRIRAYFQKGCTNYNFVKELHERFPKIIENETKEFIKRINKRRKKIGLDEYWMKIGLDENWIG